MIDKHIPLWQRFSLYAVAGGLSLGGYLFASIFIFGNTGFPLDDAWIHQTYARNFVFLGKWCFVPGEPSAGSTSPMWTLLLAIGHRVGLGPYWWAFFLGWVSLFALALIGYLVFPFLYIGGEKHAFWAGMLLLFEWHIVWASGSGMETSWFSVMVLIVALVTLMKFKKDITYPLLSGENSPNKSSHCFIFGLIIGLSTWFRPEGLTLLGPVILLLIIVNLDWKQKARLVSFLLIGFAIFVLPYLYFNVSLSGGIFPNTFYAKQGEYNILLESPIWMRMVRQLSVMLVGVGILLLPGFVFFIYHSINFKHWENLVWVGWLLGYGVIYALRLPVTYQHGRYLIPAMPLYFLFGFAGFCMVIQRYLSLDRWKFIGKTWIASTIIVELLFWTLGARAFAVDVTIIESEMVTVAKWINQNTPTDALIAAHDIGALGYFSNRKLLDLAGLVNPEVIPFIRDEAALRRYLDDKGADYLVTFPSWYPSLIQGKKKIYQTNSQISLLQGGENLEVYLWKIR